MGYHMNTRRFLKSLWITIAVASCALLTSCGKTYPDLVANAIKADISQPQDSVFYIELAGREFPERMGIAVECGGEVRSVVEIQPRPGAVRLQDTGELVIIGADAKMGETIPVQLIDLKRKRQIGKLMVYPKPIEVTKGMMRLMATAPLPDGQLWTIEAFGFDPGEAVTFGSASCGEKIGPTPINMNQNGMNIFVVSPAVIGKAGGICTCTVTTASEAVSVDLPWGTKYQELCCTQLGQNEDGIN